MGAETGGGLRNRRRGEAGDVIFGKDRRSGLMPCMAREGGEETGGAVFGKDRGRREEMPYLAKRGLRRCSAWHEKENGCGKGRRGQETRRGVRLEMLYLSRTRGLRRCNAWHEKENG